MRKLAPVFILTSIVALTSGSALALGDRNKDKRSPGADTAATQTTTGTTSTASSTDASTASTDGSSKSDKAACKGLAKSDPAYAANQCDKMMEKDAKTASTPSSSGSGK